MTQDKLNQKLLKAIKKNNYLNVLFLLRRGASFEAEVLNSDPPLYCALQKKHYKIAKLFIKKELI